MSNPHVHLATKRLPNSALRLHYTLPQHFACNWPWVYNLCSPSSWIYPLRVHPTDTRRWVPWLHSNSGFSAIAFSLTAPPNWIDASLKTNNIINMIINYYIPPTQELFLNQTVNSPLVDGYRKCRLRNKFVAEHPPGKNFVVMCMWTLYWLHCSKNGVDA